MGLGFGLLSAQARPGEADWARAYDETVRLAVEAERLGFSSVWTTEHHFVDDGYMPSLLVVAAALAQATSRIELGTGVILAPMHHPLRLAEDAATVQLLSHGRLALGLGLGWSGVEFAGFGADARRRGAAMDEDSGSSRRPGRASRSATGAPCTTCPPSPCDPRRPSRIPVLIGGSAEAADPPGGSPRRRALLERARGAVPRTARWVLNECDRIDRDPATLRFIHYSVLLPGASTAEALARYRDAAWAMRWKYSDMEASAIRPLPAAAPPPYDRPDDALVKGRDDPCRTTRRARRSPARDP